MWKWRFCPHREVIGYFFTTFATCQKTMTSHWKDVDRMIGVECFANSGYFMNLKIKKKGKVKVIQVVLLYHLIMS